MKSAAHGFKTRESHAKATRTKGMPGARRGKLPSGPHRKWAVFIREKLEELGWSQKITCQNLDVQIGWLKKAIDGKDLDGSYRRSFEQRLTAQWDKFREKRPNLAELVWPPYVETTKFEEIANSGSHSELEPPLATRDGKTSAFRSAFPSQEPQSKTANAPDSIDDFPSNLAEGAWPLHQTLQQPFANIAQNVEEALDQNKLDIAFPAFRRVLFYSGYHEQWDVRRRLTAKMLQQNLGPRDAAWVTLKAESYMEMELRDFPRAKAAIDRALDLYRQGQSKDGAGLCYRYLGDLYAKFGDIGKAMDNKLESQKYLKGIPKLESELEQELLRLRYFTEPSQQKLKQLAELGERFREIQSWRSYLTELEQAKAFRDLGNTQDALIIAKRTELTFRTQITMERTRKIAVRLIGELEENDAPSVIAAVRIH